MIIKVGLWDKEQNSAIQQCYQLCDYITDTDMMTVSLIDNIRLHLQRMSISVTISPVMWSETNVKLTISATVVAFKHPY